MKSSYSPVGTPSFSRTRITLYLMIRVFALQLYWSMELRDRVPLPRWRRLVRRGLDSSKARNPASGALKVRARTKLGGYYSGRLEDGVALSGRPRRGRRGGHGFGVSYCGRARHSEALAREFPGRARGGGTVGDFSSGCGAKISVDRLGVLAEETPA